MKKNRTEYTLKNIASGFINKFINILFPFVVRSVIIYALGTEYLGLNTFLSSVLQILNLAEMGLSSAIVFSMYKPIADGNRDEVCALLRLYKNVYKVIGLIVLLLGLALMPFIPYLISGTYPQDVNLYIVYFVYLINTVVSYYFYSYKAALLNASQQISVTYSINSIMITIQSVAQIVIVAFLKNYLLFIAIMPVFTILNNIIVGYLSRKYYPEYEARGDIASEIVASIKKRVAGLFITRICTVTRNALDSIFISAMIGLNMVAIYGNYYYIMGAVFSIVSIIITSMTASVGNSMAKESVAKNYSDMRKFDFIFSWIATLCVALLLCLCQPFMKIWVGDDLCFPYYMVILFAIYFYSLSLGSIRSAYHDAAGLWWEARYRAIIETAVNIVLNFVLTMLLGVAGTIMSTIVSILIVNFGYGTSIVFKHYFKGISMRQYFVDHLVYTLATTIVSVIAVMACNIVIIDGVIGILVKGAICFVSTNAMLLVMYRKSPLFKESALFAKKYIKKRYNKHSSH